MKQTISAMIFFLLAALLLFILLLSYVNPGMSWELRATPRTKAPRTLPGYSARLVPGSG